jgi:CubicO group peptidase (beta-lactamase class C family)
MVSRLLSRWLVALSLVGAACSHAPATGEPRPPETQASTPATPRASPVAAAPTAPERLTADAPRSTSGGTTFTAPTGWSLSTRSSLTLLDPPEPDSHLALVDVPGADATAAVKAAWAAYRPEAKRPVKLVTPRPARNGWDERQVFDYETSPNERAVVQAVAQRKGQSWTVAILDGTEPTFEKRAAATRLVLQSLRPKGYERESFAGRKAHPLDAERIAQMKAFVEQSMRQLGVPGVGLAFIDGGKILDEGGLGVRELGKPEPVDANTLFLAASNTKGMTTLLLARLVDEKKLRWDEPVVKVYPKFKLGDPEVTPQVLVKHLICACTGLPRQDLEFVFEFGAATPASSFALLGTMKPTSKFGEVFQYSNLMASVAGYIGGHLYYPRAELGAAYDRAMHDKIFAPLGMRSTTFDMRRALKANHASPHGEDADGTVKVADFDPNYCIVPYRPAGGVWTSAHDFIRYAQLELERGKLPDGRRLVSEENLLARRTTQVPIGEDQVYGMGMMVDTTWGVPVVHHGGDLFGHHSDFFVLPDHGVAAVLLTNGDIGYLMRRAFMRRLLEVLFDGRPEGVDDVTAAAARHKAERAKIRERLVIPPDPTELDKLAVVYRNPSLGRLRVVRRSDATVFHFGEWGSAVASRKNDDGTVSVITIGPTEQDFEFVAGNREGKRILTIRDGQHEYVFVES